MDIDDPSLSPTERYAVLACILRDRIRTIGDLLIERSPESIDLAAEVARQTLDWSERLLVDSIGG
jgi:hypothetical protein